MASSNPYIPDNAVAEYDAMQDSLGREQDGAPILCGGRYGKVMGAYASASGQAVPIFCTRPAVPDTEELYCAHHGVEDCKDALAFDDTCPARYRMTVSEREGVVAEMAKYEAARKLEVGR